MKIKVLLFLMMLLLASFVGAKEAELREDPEIKERFKHLTSELRCLKCQNQTIYDSEAGLADDLKQQVRTQIYSGKTDEEIVEYMVDRYGDFIRFKPVMDSKNILLWVGPFVFLLMGGLLLFRYVKERKKETNEDDEAISEDNRLRAKKILKQGED